MKDGWIKATAVTPTVVPGNPVACASDIVRAIRDASADGAAIAVLPELCVTGYTSADLFYQSALLDGAERALAAILAETAALQTVVLVGMPVRAGGMLYDCAVVLYGGELLGVVPKTMLHNHTEPYEARYFSQAPEITSAVTLCGRTAPFGTRLLFQNREMPDMLLAAEIGADAYALVPPSAAHIRAGATVICHLSARCAGVGQAAQRRKMLAAQSKRMLCAYVSAEAGSGESTTDAVYSAHNIITENGTVLAESAPFAEGCASTEIDVAFLAAERRRQHAWLPDENGYTVVPFTMQNTETALTRQYRVTPFVPEAQEARAQRCREVEAIQIQGLARRLAHLGTAAAVIGVSGGLDSAWALHITAQAFDRLGYERSGITAVSMPCFGTSARTRGNAAALSRALGVALREIDISDAVRQHLRNIGHDGVTPDIVYENAQARERTQVLMDIANSVNGIVIGTGNLSELALGWATYNGDHMSMYAVSASVPKTLLRAMTEEEAARCGNAALRAVLEDILQTPVSPELKPGDQKTETLVGPYLLHDFFLYHAIRRSCPPRKVLRLAQHAFAGQYNPETVLAWLHVFYRRFFAQQYKRSCMPDGPQVGSLSFSPRGAFKMPSDASAAVWLAELETLA